MDEDHGQTLTFGQILKSHSQLGLNPRLLRVGPGEHDRRLAATRAALANPIEVAQRIRHRSNLLPVLPRIRERITRRLTTGIDPIRSDESTTESRLCPFEERFEPFMSTGHGSRSH
jgi:hypothetical protein